MSSNNIEIRRTNYANGKPWTEVGYKNGQVHGVSKEWFENGVLASEMPVKNGLVHGLVKYWNPEGNLIGSFRMKNGTGIMKTWHPNGQIRGEVATVRGQMLGQFRAWDTDGTRLPDHFFLQGGIVSRKTYLEARRKDPLLPPIYEQPAVKKPKSNVRLSQKTPVISDIQRRRHKRVIKKMLSNPAQAEALSWLKKSENHTLGEMPHNPSVNLVQDGYSAGAQEIRGVEIDEYSHGANTGKLIVTLPDSPKARRKVFAWAAPLAEAIGYTPERDWGQKEIFVWLD
jgi:hypothetical protein